MSKGVIDILGKTLLGLERSVSVRSDDPALAKVHSEILGMIIRLQAARQAEEIEQADRKAA